MRRGVGGGGLVLGGGVGAGVGGGLILEGVGGGALVGGDVAFVFGHIRKIKRVDLLLPCPLVVVAAVVAVVCTVGVVPVLT